MKQAIILFILSLFPAFCLADESYMATYNLYATWDSYKNTYVKGAEISKEPMNIPSIRISSQGLYMPENTMVCANPKYKTESLPIQQIPKQFLNVMGETGTSAITIQVNSDSCGMLLMLVNNKFLMLFAHDDPPIIYIKQ